MKHGTWCDRRTSCTKAPTFNALDLLSEASSNVLQIRVDGETSIGSNEASGSSDIGCIDESCSGPPLACLDHIGQLLQKSLSNLMLGQTMTIWTYSEITVRRIMLQRKKGESLAYDAHMYPTKTDSCVISGNWCCNSLDGHRLACNMLWRTVIQLHICVVILKNTDTSFLDKVEANKGEGLRLWNGTRPLACFSAPVRCRSASWALNFSWMPCKRSAVAFAMAAWPITVASCISAGVTMDGSPWCNMDGEQYQSIQNVVLMLFAFILQQNRHSETMVAQSKVHNKLNGSCSKNHISMKCNPDDMQLDNADNKSGTTKY